MVFMQKKCLLITKNITIMKKNVLIAVSILFVSALLLFVGCNNNSTPPVTLDEETLKAVSQMLSGEEGLKYWFKHKDITEATYTSWGSNKDTVTNHFSNTKEYKDSLNTIVYCFTENTFRSENLKNGKIFLNSDNKAKSYYITADENGQLIIKYETNYSQETQGVPRYLDYIEILNITNDSLALRRWLVYHYESETTYDDQRTSEDMYFVTRDVQVEEVKH